MKKKDRQKKELTKSTKSSSDTNKQTNKHSFTPPPPLSLEQAKTSKRQSRSNDRLFLSFSFTRSPIRASQKVHERQTKTKKIQALLTAARLPGQYSLYDLCLYRSWIYRSWLIYLLYLSPLDLSLYLQFIYRSLTDLSVLNRPICYYVPSISDRRLF